MSLWYRYMIMNFSYSVESSFTACKGMKGWQIFWWKPSIITFFFRPSPIDINMIWKSGNFDYVQGVSHLGNLIPWTFRPRLVILYPAVLSLRAQSLVVSYRGHFILFVVRFLPQYFFFFWFCWALWEWSLSIKYFLYLFSWRRRFITILFSSPFIL